ncbi:uncharacterized protein N7479_008908 [Penicillium vulpinum]|uniref:uncharacterized protein n=1 Tax=Penicillium vulpinum TaxID=29845 RepID=UPI0025498EB0|nr:uncharacterized protein N7479_008908 [Penicillium vulpinum]KAJ5950495.1 hypothetical protein N7479_008908 [Penicillium vulpinum]
MQITNLKLVLLASLLGTSDALLFKWTRIASDKCAMLPFTFGFPDPGCPGGAALPAPAAPAPDPKAVAAAYCNNVAAGAIAVFRADGSHYGCFNNPCQETFPGSNEINGVCR